MSDRTKINQVPGRNDLCICGSGKKHKKCCLGASGIPSVSSQNALMEADQYMRAGDLESAEVFFRKALKDKKNYIAGLVGLGQCLCQQWRYKEGIALIQKAAEKLTVQAKKNRDVRQLLDLAYFLVDLNEPRKALKFVDSALAIVPDFPRAHHTKALALQKIDAKKALITAKKTVALAPNESNAIVLLASLEAKQGQLDVAKQRLLNITKNKIPCDLARVQKELGIVLDKLGEYDEAFACFKKSGSLLRERPEVQGINRQAIYQELMKNRQIFDRRFFERCVEQNTDNNPAPVFLIGFYRSGTTLMEQVLSAHPNIVTSDEAYILPQVVKEISRISKHKTLSLQEKVKFLSDDELSYLRQYYWKTAKQMVGKNLSNKLFVDKTTMNTINLGLINRLFPDATALFAVRDPRDVLLSCYMQSFSLSPLTTHFLDWQEGAKFYAAVMEYWMDIRDDLSMTCIEIRYEEVVRDLEAQFTPVIQQLGLAWSDNCRKFHISAQQKAIKTPSFDQVTKPLYQSSLSRWQHYEQYFEEIKEALQKPIQYFGYE